MIVMCPACHSKYSVQNEAIGESKMVRCAICGTTWYQSTPDKSLENKNNVIHVMKWAFFWFAVFISIFSIFFAKNTMMKIWPPIFEFYRVIGITTAEDARKTLVIQNVSNFFAQKDNKLYMGLKGELVNVSNEVQILPSVTISLKDDESAVEKKGRASYKKIWTHDLMYKKLLPNQKVIFETELQSVPYNNLVCDIKLDAI